MPGVYGGLIMILLYGTNANEFEDFFLWLDDTPFTLLDGQHLLLL